MVIVLGAPIWSEAPVSPAPLGSSSSVAEYPELLGELLAKVVSGLGFEPSEDVMEAESGSRHQETARWWIGLVPALSACSPAEAALEVALARLSAEVPDCEVVVFLPDTLPESHPILSKLSGVRKVAITNDEYASMAAAWPLPRLAISSRSRRTLLETSVPRGWADEAELFDTLISFRRWAIESE